MFGTVARGTYVLVLTAIIVAWAVSLGKEAPGRGAARPADLVHLFLTHYLVTRRAASPFPIGEVKRVRQELQNQDARKASISPINFSQAGSPASKR